MIVIGIAYMCIIGYEWWYLTRKKRKKRTFVAVLGSAVLMCLCLETLSLFEKEWTIAKLIEGVFGPVETLMRAGK